jgi:hypothetical protein
LIVEHSTVEIPFDPSGTDHRHTHKQNSEIVHTAYVSEKQDACPIDSGYLTSPKMNVGPDVEISDSVLSGERVGSPDKLNARRP